MGYFLQQLINGLTFGSIYGLIAIGYTMVYGILGMINFAHGDIFMLGSFIAILAILVLGVTAGTPVLLLLLALLLVLVIAMTINGVWGWTLERLAYRPLRGSFRLAPLITAIGISIAISNFVQVTQGPGIKPIPAIITGAYRFDIGGTIVQVSNTQIVVVAATLVLMAIFAFIITRTPLGRAQRAVEQDPRMASLLGVNVDQTISITFVIGASLAAFAGLLYLLYYGVISFSMGFNAGVNAFTAAVLGGIGSIPGAMLGGLLLGLIETMWGGYISTEYKDVASFAILAIVLILFPSGLLGRPEVEKV